jgi:hypothetical protein
MTGFGKALEALFSLLKACPPDGRSAPQVSSVHY